MKERRGKKQEATLRLLLTHDDVLNPNLDRMSRGTMTTSQVEILFQIFLERPISSHNDQKIGKYIATNLRSYNKVHVEFLIRWQRRGGDKMVVSRYNYLID